MEQKFDGKLRFNKANVWWEAYLPSECPQNHASNLLELTNGDILCTWFSGTQEGVSDISIFLSRLNQGTEVWTKPVKMSDDSQRSEQNPLLFEAPDGKLWLLYTAQKFGNQDTAIVRYRVSSDKGYTWSEIQVLIDEPGTFIRQPVTVLPNGNWLLPIFRCATRPGEKWVGNHDTSAVKVSKDGGNTWEEHTVPESIGCVHMNINILKDGTLVALYRSRWADHIYRSTSVDGCSWTEPEALAMPNNNSSIQAVVLKDGAMAMVFNDISSADSTDRRASLYDEIEEGSVDDAERNVVHDVPVDKLGRKAVWGTPRAPMSIALSEDGGRTWPYIRHIQEGDGRCLSNNSAEKKNREFSYPSIKQGKNGDIHVSFTYFRQTIKYVRITEDWIKGK